MSCNNAVKDHRTAKFEIKFILKIARWKMIIAYATNYTQTHTCTQSGPNENIVSPIRHILNKSNHAQTCYIYAFTASSAADAAATADAAASVTVATRRHSISRPQPATNKAKSEVVVRCTGCGVVTDVCCAMRGEVRCCACIRA